MTPLNRGNVTDFRVLSYIVTPIYYGSNESSEKDVFGSEKSSERSSERSSGTGSGTHPHKVLVQAKRQRRAWGHPYNREQAKNIQEIDLSMIFAR